MVRLEAVGHSWLKIFELLLRFLFLSIMFKIINLFSEFTLLKTAGCIIIIKYILTQAPTFLPE